MSLKRFLSPDKRRCYLEQTLSIHLDQIKNHQIDEKEILHCENIIGATTLPLGVAGPLRIQNLESGIQNYYIPLATTEGALVASVNRGCKAILQSGGAIGAVEKVGTTRGPVFETTGIAESLRFKKWLYDNFAIIKKEAEKTSSHLKLEKLETSLTGRYVYVRFYFDTQDAMGMNMVTIATEAIAKIIKLKTKIECLSLSGNFCNDKKPNWLNFISGRGKRVWAEVVLKEKVITEVLKTTSEKLFEVWLSKCLIGSIMSGSLAFNSHFANVVAAFYAATGQDLAHVIEGSLGITTMKLLNKDLYVSVYLPDVMVATVGGGTKLKIKQEALSIIGVKNSTKLAEVLGGAVLAGEISLMASLAQGTLAVSHKKLGR